MQKVAIPVVVLGLVVAGLFLSGILGDDPAHAPRSIEDSGPVEVRERADLGPGAESGSSIPTASSGAPETAEAEVTATDSPTVATGAIAGRVVDDTGAPIEGAIVHAVPEEAMRPGFWRPTAAPDLDSQEGRTTTGPDGSFRIDTIGNRSTYTVFARGSGWVGERMRNVTPDHEPLEFVLEVGELVRGVVLDPRGRPVAGARVQAGPTMTKLGDSMFIPAGGHFDQDELMPVAETGADGTFSLAEIPQGDFSLAASHDRFGPSEVVNLMQGQVGLTLELRPNAGIEGRVIDPDGRPVAGATVSTMALGFWAGTNGDSNSTRTDELGIFRLEGLSAGQHRIVVRAEGFPTRNDRAGVVVGEGTFVTDVEIVLERGASVRGIVVATDGAPVEGAVVSLDREEAHRGLRMVRAGDPSGGHRTDANGVFLIDGLSSSDLDVLHSLVVEHEDHARYEGTPMALTPGGETDLGTITLVEATTVSGRVLDLEGAPIADAKVSLVRPTPEGEDDRFVERSIEIVSMGDGGPIVFEGGPNLADATTDEEGRYRLKVERSGEFVVKARARGFQKADSVLFAVGERSVTDIDVTLFPAMQISGAVVDELGAPCAEVGVFAHSGAGGHESVETDADGVFLIDGLDEGAYQLNISSEGWSLAGDAQTVDAGSEGVTLVVRRPGRVEGRIIDQVSGLPITEFSLRTAPDVTGIGGGTFRISALSLGGVEYRDPDGRFAVEDLAPGSHSLTVRAPNMVEKTVRVDVASGRTTETLVELERAGSVSGRVLDTAGRPIEGVRVKWAALDEDGNEKAEEGEGGNLAIGISFVATIEVDDGGGGSGFQLIGGGGPQPVHTDENGEFLVEGLADGSVRLTFTHDEFRETSESPIPVERGREREIGTVEMLRGASVRGSVRTADGRELMWASISLRPENGGSAKDSGPDGEGNYSIGGLDAGTYSMRVNYMIRPESEGAFGDAFGGGENKTHEIGTVELDTDEVRMLDIVLPSV